MVSDTTRTWCLTLHVKKKSWFGMKRVKICENFVSSWCPTPRNKNWRRTLILIGVRHYVHKWSTMHCIEHTKTRVFFMNLMSVRHSLDLIGVAHYIYEMSLIIKSSLLCLHIMINDFTFNKDENRNFNNT